MVAYLSFQNFFKEKNISSLYQKLHCQVKNAKGILGINSRILCDWVSKNSDFFLIWWNVNLEQTQKNWKQLKFLTINVEYIIPWVRGVLDQSCLKTKEKRTKGLSKSHLLCVFKLFVQIMLFPKPCGNFWLLLDRHEDQKNFTFFFEFFWIIKTWWSDRAYHDVGMVLHFLKVLKSFSKNLSYFFWLLLVIYK